MRNGAFVVLLASVSLSGCNYAAKQVLGDQALVISPTKGQRLEAGRIYRVKKGGVFSPVCSADMGNKALQYIKVETVEDSSDVVADQIPGEGAKLVVPGFPELQVPYYKTQVTGYRVKTASPSGNSDLYTEIANGVGSNCRKLLAQDNVIVVESEARAKQSAQLVKGPINELAIGVAKIDKIGDQIVLRSPKNVTFGVVVAQP